MTAAPEPRCERTELLVSQCDHCRPKPPVAKPEISYRFNAMYPGRCSICDFGFYEDTRIGRLADGDLACPDCCEELT